VYELIRIRRIAKCLKFLSFILHQGTSADAFAILQNTAAYTMSGSVAGLSWLCAQEAFVKVSHEECRSILAKSFLYTYEVLK